MILAALVLVTAVAIIALTWGASLRNTVSLLNQRAVDLTYSGRTLLRTELGGAEAVVQATLAAVKDGRLDPSDRGTMEPWLLGALSATPQVRVAALYGPDRQGWSVHRAEGPLTVEAVSRAAPESVAAVFEDAEARPPLPYWGEVVHVGGASMINLRTQLPWPGGGFGLMAVAISLDELSRQVALEAERLGWTGFILLGQDHVLAHPYLIDNAEALSAERPVLPLSELPDPALRAIWHAGPSTQFGAAAEDGTQVWVGPSDDPAYLYLFGSTTAYGKTPWYFGAYAPLDLVDVEFRRVVGSGIVAIGIALLAILIAIWIGRRLSRPISEAADIATRISTLDLKDIGRLPQTGVRELDRQADAFNRMIDALRAFATYVPRQLVAQLAANGFDRDLPSLAGPVTVLFTDIVGFTALTEHLPADETADLLNRHFSLLGDAVEREGGIIDKYIGDSLMAFWAKPLAPDDAPVHAVTAARSIAEALAEDNRERAALDEPPVHVRIGIHTGPALAGNIGAVGRVNYTVVGDTVNVAQRLQDFGRKVSPDAECVVLMSDAVVEALPAGFRRGSVGEIMLRGREEPVAVWKLELDGV